VAVITIRSSAIQIGNGTIAAFKACIVMRDWHQTDVIERACHETDMAGAATCLTSSRRKPHA
jgi:hypothetical protein